MHVNIVNEQIDLRVGVQAYAYVIGASVHGSEEEISQPVKVVCAALANYVMIDLALRAVVHHQVENQPVGEAVRDGFDHVHGLYRAYHPNDIQTGRKRIDREGQPVAAGVQAYNRHGRTGFAGICRCASAHILNRLGELLSHLLFYAVHFNCDEITEKRSVVEWIYRMNVLLAI